jgi:hypothetical protein
MLGNRKSKHLYLKLTSKVRTFLLKVLGREFLIFLFFTVVAAGFWLLQTLDNDYEMVVEVPVHLKGVPDDVVVTEDPVEKLQVKVKDRGSALLNYVVGRHLKAIALDFGERKGVDGLVTIPASSLERDVQSRLNVSTKVVEIQPDTLSYVFTHGECRKVRVVASGELKAARQYYVSATLFTPDSVLVYAPRHILDTLSVAATEPLYLTDLSESGSQDVAIAKVKGAKFVPSEVKLSYSVDVYTEKTIEVPVHGVGFPDGMVLRTFPATVKVTFMVGLDKFNRIHPSDFNAVISYEEYLNNSSDKLGVTLESWPDFVGNVRIAPERVDFLIEKE